MTTRERYPVGRDYQVMVNALADVAKRRDEELTAAERAYQDSAAQASGELARAEGEATAADRRAGAAAAAVLEVDREAARLWEQLGRTNRMRARALGELPEPAAVETLPRMAIQRGPNQADGGTRPPTARALLSSAADRIDAGTRKVPRRPLPRWALPLLPLVGALTAAATGLLAAGLVTLGESGLVGGGLLRALGWLVFVIAPSAGVPAAAHTAHRVLNARLDIGGVGLTLLGGMIAATVLSLTFAGTR
ncbi:MAG TPA: hypothetical protein VFO77_00110 [Actinoplanes sp.]|nr:hypothetical protein [Actinoplanes sp.]